MSINGGGSGRCFLRLPATPPDLQLPDEAHLGVCAGGVVFFVAGWGVDVAALVGGDHHARVLRQTLHPLLHPAVVLRAAVVAPASCMQYIAGNSGYLFYIHVPSLLQFS